MKSVCETIDLEVLINNNNNNNNNSNLIWRVGRTVATNRADVDLP